MLGLLNKSLTLLAVLQWKCVLGISCPCPWFRPQSSTANLFGFNQSSPWLMVFLSSFFSYMPSFPSLLSFWTLCFIHNFPLFLLISLPFRSPMPLLAISMLILWLCSGNVAHKNLADPRVFPICWLLPLKQTQVSVTVSGNVQQGRPSTSATKGWYPWPNLTGLHEKAIDVAITFLFLTGPVCKIQKHPAQWFPTGSALGPRFLLSH